MKNTIITSLIALAGVASAAEVSASAGIHSRYIFRGIDFNAGENELVDFGIELAEEGYNGYNWYVGTWYGSATNEAGDDYNEQDIYAGVSKDFSFGSLDFGAVTYTYDNVTAADATGVVGLENDAEIYLGYSTDIAGLSFSSTTSYGVGGWWKNGVYQDIAIGTSFDFADWVTGALDLQAGFFMGEALYAPGVDGLGVYSATFSLDYAISDSASFAPYVTWIETTETFQAASGAAGTNGFVLGASLSISL